MGEGAADGTSEGEARVEGDTRELLGLSGLDVETDAETQIRSMPPMRRAGLEAGPPALDDVTNIRPLVREGYRRGE